MSGWTPKAMKIPVHPAIFRGVDNHARDSNVDDNGN